MKHRTFTALALATLLSACAGPRSMMEQLAAPVEPRHQRDFAEGAKRVCEVSREVLLGDGYVVEARGEDGVVGARETPVTAEEDKSESYAHFRVYVTCVEREVGSTLFVTATEERFGVKTIRDSTLIGLPMVSPISVGRRTEGEQQVKFSGKTVEEQEFYDRFYKAVRAGLAARAKALMSPRPQPAAPAAAEEKPKAEAQ